MKKKVLASVLLSSIVLSTGVSVLAATGTPAKTKGDAGFVVGNRPDVVKPEEGPNEPEILDPDVDPTDPTKPKPLPETEGIYVTHLPDFSFGKDNKTSIKTENYQAEWEKRTRNSGAETFYMPHSVQVADLSGANKTWKLSVTQDAAFASETSSAGLTNSRIRLLGNTFTNSGKAATDLVGKITGVALADSDATVANYTEIPMAGESTGALDILANTEAGFTNNTYTSAVFDTGYLEESYTPILTPNASKYDGVKLNVPASDQSKAEVYNTNLTWTLTVEP